MLPPTTKPHRLQAFAYWQLWLTPTDTVIDATCGNGKDTLVLAQLASRGAVISLDIQEIALSRARVLTSHLDNVLFYHQSHALFPPIKKPVKLIVYNLGYLPGGDKTVTTKTEITLQSLKAALELTDNGSGGAISITCYPGHPEGKKELLAIKAYLNTLPTPGKITIHEWGETKPVLIWIQSRCSTFKAV